MKKFQLISSYAHVLFQLSVNDLDTVREEVGFLLVFFKSQIDIFTYLSNPVISTKHKKEVVLCLKEYLSEGLVKFIIVICINKRFNLLFSILEKFLSFLRKNKNEFEITIESTKSLNDSDIKIITESLSFLGKIMKVSNVINPSILGGFIIRYDSYLIDASLKNYLEQMVNLSREEILGYNK